jgi:hypothetical protein
MPSSHALLSPSSAHRWLNCTAAPRLEEHFEDEGSDYAREGTLAHAYCAKRLKEYLGLPTDDEDAEIDEYADYLTGEMAEHVDTYYTIVIEKYNEALKRTADAKLLVEVQLDFSDVIPESFGTSDAVIIADDEMEVIDFKYGKGVKVSATENPQMMIYALGAYNAYSDEYNIKKVRMTIVQPRLDSLSEYELTVRKLKKWTKDVLKPRARAAFKGEGEQMPGEWCRFCKCKGQCRALAKKSIETATRFESPDLISDDEMAHEVLPSLPVIRTWLEAVETYALKQALAGSTFDGYKVVAGRSIRKIVNPDAVMATLDEHGFRADDYLKPSELRSLGDLERLVGKKRFSELCGSFIDKPQGKPTLVTIDDKREAYNPAAADFQDFV